MAVLTQKQANAKLVAQAQPTVSPPSPPPTSPSLADVVSRGGADYQNTRNVATMALNQNPSANLNAQNVVNTALTSPPQPPPMSPPPNLTPNESATYQWALGQQGVKTPQNPLGTNPYSGSQWTNQNGYWANTPQEGTTEQNRPKFDWAGNPLGPGGEVLTPSTFGGNQSSTALQPGQGFNSSVGIFGPQGSAVQGGESYKGGSMQGMNTVRSPLNHYVGTINGDPLLSRPATPYGSPAGDFAARSVNTPGVDVKPGIEKNLRYSTTNVGGFTGTDATTIGPNVQDTKPQIDYFSDQIGNLDKPFQTETGDYSFGYTPADKFEGQGKHIPRQLNDFIKENATTLGLGELEAVDGGDVAAILEGKWNSETAAQKAADRLKATIAANSTEGSDLRRLDLKPRLVNGKWVLKAVGTKTSAGIKFTEKQPGDGKKTTTDQATSDTLGYNQNILDMMKFFGEQTRNAAQERSAAYKLAQEQLANSIQGINAGSESQKQNLMNSLMVPLQQGMDTLERQKGLSTRQTSADLMNKGFGRSNVGYVNPATGQLQGPAFEEGVTQPYEKGVYDLGNVMAQNLFSGENQIQQNAIQKLQALAGVSGPEFPGNVPGLSQLQPGTFAPKITPQDILAAVSIFAKDIPAAQQKNMVDVIQAVLSSFSGVTAPSLGAQAITAGSNVASAFAGGGSPKKP